VYERERGEKEGRKKERKKGRKEGRKRKKGEGDKRGKSTDIFVLLVGVEFYLIIRWKGPLGPPRIVPRAFVDTKICGF
jgi:hypothetical protein